MSKSGRKDCTHWAGLAASAPQSLSVWPRTERTWPSLHEGRRAAPTVVKEIELDGRKAIAILADATTSGPSKLRSKRPSRPSAGSMSL